MSKEEQEEDSVPEVTAPIEEEDSTEVVPLPLPPIENPKKELIPISDIKGVGGLTVTKLKQLGIENISDLAIASPLDIHEKLASTKHPYAFCEGLVVYANEYLQKSGLMDDIVTSTKLFKDDQVRKRFSTGDKMLDDWFGGGIESKAVTELYGRFKSGKTQICDCAAVTTAGSGKNVLFIDTENTYSPTRINEIALQKNLDPDIVHENIKVTKPKAASMLFVQTQNILSTIRKYNIELIIVDSIIALHRSEFIGRSHLSDRQQDLARIMSYLVKAAEHCDIGIIITNQVLESPDPFKPGQFATGGNIISHASTHRVYLKTKGSTNSISSTKNIKSYSTAVMEDSPRYPRTELMIELGKFGVRGIDASKPLPKD